MKNTPKMLSTTSMADSLAARKYQPFSLQSQIFSTQNANSTSTAAAKEEDTATTCMSSLYLRALKKNFSKTCIFSTHNTAPKRDQRAWILSKREEKRGEETRRKRNTERKPKKDPNHGIESDNDPETKKIVRDLNLQKEVVQSREELLSTNGMQITINDLKYIKSSVS